MGRPFIIHEASVTAYESLPGGAPGAVLWTATALEGMDLSARRRFRPIWPTGATKPTRRRVGPGRHELSFNRIWRLPAAAPADLDPLAVETLVLDVLWQDQRTPGLWHQRRYPEAVWVEDALSGSVGQPFLSRMRFEAHEVIQSNSAGSQPAGLTAAVQQVLFSREAALTNGVALAGLAAWSVPVQLLHAQITWHPATGTGASTTLRCQVSGQTDHLDYLLPDGNPATLSTATFDMEGELPVVPAGETVTWSAAAAPANLLECATRVGVVMTVQPVLET